MLIEALEPQRGFQCLDQRGHSTGRQRGREDAIEHTKQAPTHKTIVQGRVWIIGFRRVLPLSPAGSRR